MNDHSTDLDIDRAARAMTDIDPPHDLEARIKRRLDSETRPPSSRWRRAYWVGAAGLTATAVVLAIVVQEPTGPRSPEVPESGPRSPEVPESRGPEVQGSRGPGVPKIPIRLPAYRTASEAELAWMSRTVEALDVIDVIQPEPVSITPLTMTPLTTPTYPDVGGWRH